VLLPIAAGELIVVGRVAEPLLLLLFLLMLQLTLMLLLCQFCA
jgi:hypothetical protein